MKEDEHEVLKNIYGPAQGHSGKYKDDITGQLLKDELVFKASAIELEYFNSKGVWKKVPRYNARAATGRPPVTVRWVDINKDNEIHHNYRSRLVARQMKVMDGSGQSFFAPATEFRGTKDSLQSCDDKGRRAQARLGASFSEPFSGKLGGCKGGIF